MFKKILILLSFILFTKASVPDLDPSMNDGSYYLVQVSSTSPSKCSECSKELKEL